MNNPSQGVRIESCISRPGTTSKPRLSDPLDVLVDFDLLGSQMPDSDVWQNLTKSWNISKDSLITVFESTGVFCGPRLVYMLRSTGYHFAQSDAINPHLDKEARFNGFVNCEDVQQALAEKLTVIDVRGHARFSGEEADPRPNVRSGHIPNSINMPYGEFISAENPLKLKSNTELMLVFENAKINLQEPVIFSCGSGITACIGAIAAIVCGARLCSVYDGSWAEWGARKDLPAAIL